MSERPTLETDAFITSQDYSPTGHQWRNFTRKLERERDEAREALMKIEDRCVDCEDIQKIRDIAVKALEGAK